METQISLFAEDIIKKRKKEKENARISPWYWIETEYQCELIVLDMYMQIDLERYTRVCTHTLCVCVPLCLLRSTSMRLRKL